MERLYADWIDEYEKNGTKFIDPDFKYDDTRNFGGNKKNNYQRIPDFAKFIVNGIDTFDVSQGKLGNCWFLSSIAALALKRKFIKRVLMTPFFRVLFLVLFFAKIYLACRAYFEG